MDSELVSGAGEGVAEDPPSTLSERRLEERALREGWPMSPERSALDPDRLLKVVEQKAEGDPPVAIRYVVQAAQALIAADMGPLPIPLPTRPCCASGTGADDREDGPDEASRLAERPQ